MIIVKKSVALPNYEMIGTPVNIKVTPVLIETHIWYNCNMRTSRRCCFISSFFMIPSFAFCGGNFVWKHINYSINCSMAEYGNFSRHVKVLA